ncbi:hypothetical protein [Actinoallomurus acanthiterrae]
MRATGGMLVVAGHQYKVAESASTVGGDVPQGADQDAVAAKDPYRLPEGNFDQPVGEFDTLPEIVQKGLFFLEMLVGGCQWPDGSMDGLGRIQSALTTCADAFGTAAGELDAHAGVVVNANAGEATDKFKTFAQALSGGGEAGGLRFLEQVLRGLASSVEGLQAQKRAARLQFELSCAFIVITMAIGFAWSFITAGASEAAAIGASEAEGFALKAFLQRIAVWAGQHQILSAAAVGAWFGAGMDSAGQYARIHEGVQKGWNWGEFGKSVGMGAIAGGVMGAAGRAVPALAGRGNPVATKLADWMGAPGMKGVGARFGFAGTTGTAGNLAGQAVFDRDHMNVGQAAAFGFGMAGFGAAKEAGQYTAGRFRNGGDDGQVPVPPVSDSGIPNDRPTYPHKSDTGVGYDIKGEAHDNPNPTNVSGPVHNITTLPERPTSGGTGGTHGTDLASVGRQESSGGGGTGHSLDSPLTGGQGRPISGGDVGGTGGPDRGQTPPGQLGPAALPGRPPEAGPPGVRPGESARPSIAEALNGDGRTGNRPGTNPGHPDGTTGNAPRQHETGPGTGESPKPGGNGHGTKPEEGSTGTRPDDPTAPTGRTPHATSDPAGMARNAMDEARRAVVPDGMPLRDGGVRVTGADGRSVHLPYERLREAQDRLAARAAEGVTNERLCAEAARWLGAELARSTGGHPLEGGLDALHRLAENSPETRPVATELAHQTLAAHPERADLAANWPVSETRPEPSPVMRPGMHEPAAQELVHQADELASALSTPVTPDPGASQAPRTGPGSTPGGVHSAPDAAGSTVPAPDRPAHLQPLSIDEVGSAIAELRPAHLGRGVTGLEWNPDTATLRVRTESGAVHDFHVSVGDTDGAAARTRVGADGRTHEMTCAPWMMSKEAAQAAHLSPERVAEAADELPRTVLHQMTDTLQRVSAAEARAGHGIIRRCLEAVGPGRHGDRSASGYNQHRYLADKYLHTTDPVEQAHYVREINDLARDMHAKGRTPPSPPWVSGADGIRPAERPATSTTPEAARVAELTDQVGKVRESLRNDITALEDRVAEHRKLADEAGKDVQAAFDSVTKAAGERDHAAATRATDAVADGRAALDRQVRHTEIADGYDKALKEARQADISYDAAQRCLNQLTEHPDPATAKTTAAAAAILVKRGAEEMASYGHAMDKTMPPDAALAGGEIMGPLAHLNGLTETTNKCVEAAGSTSRFAPDALEKTLRGSTHDLLSESGVLVPLDESGAFVRIQAEVTDLVEVKPEMDPAESMSGGFAEGGHGHGATAAHTQTTAVSVDSSKLAMLIPDGVHPILDGAKAVLKNFGPGVEVDVGRGRSVSGNGLQHGQPGAVVDIRNGEVRVLDGRVTYKVSVIPGHDVPETPVTHVTEGTREDSPTMQVLLSNSFTGRDLPESVQLPAGEGTGKMPHHHVAELSGLEKWHDDVVAAITQEKGEVDPVTRDQLRNILTQEAKEHLGQMVNKPNGERRAIPGTDLAVRFEAELDLGKFVAMHSSKVDWIEKVDVGLSGTSGNQSFNVSKQVGGSIPLPIDKLWGGAKDLMPGPHEVNVGISGKLNGSRGVTHSESVNVGGTSVAVFVERFVGRTQAELIQPGGVVVKAHLYSLSDNRPLGTVSGDLGGLIRLSAKDAAEAGMPVDVAAVKVDQSGAIVRNPDGSVATPEDHGPVAPSERKGIPVHIGDGPGQLRGAGFALVRDITGIGEAVTKAMPMMRDLKLVPKLDGNEMPIAPNHPDRLEFLHELANLRRLEDFPERFFDPHYDQLCQEGMGFELPNGHSLTVRLEQRFDEFTDLGPDGSRNLVGLNIDSQSSSTGVNDSVSLSGGGGVSGAWKNFGDHKAGFDANLGGSGGVNRGHSEGRSDTAFVNHVGLKELKQVRLFEGKHEAVVEIRDRHQKLVGRFTADGTAAVRWPSEILPDAQARPAEVERLQSPEGTQPTPKKLAKDAYWEQIDAGPVLKDLGEKAPPRVLATEGAKAFLSSSSLRGAKEKLLGSGYETSVVVDPHGPRPRSYTIKAEVEMGPSKVTDAHDSVTGDVNLTVEGTSTSSSHTKGGNVSGSAGGGHHGADGSSLDGGADLTRSGSTTTGESKNSSSGLERLDIQVGKDVGVHASAHLKITVTDDRTGKSWESSGDVGARLAVRENDMLAMHLNDEYHLPLDRMSDLVERLGNGASELGPNLAVKVVGRYAEDLRAAIHSGEELPPLAQSHTPEFLGDVLEKVTGVGHDLTGTPEEHRLNEVATHAADLEMPPVEVAVPEAYEKGVGMSLYDHVSLDKPIHTAVLEAVEKNSPGALDRDPTLRQALSQMYEGARWEGPSDNMFDPWGARDDVRVVDETGRSHMVTIRVKAEWNGRPVMYDKIPGKVPIFQAYGYKGHGATKSLSQSLGGDVNATHGTAAGGSVNGSVGTGRSRSVTTSVGHENIRVKRLMWTDADSPAANAAKATNETGKRSLLDDKTGMAQLEHAVKITVTAETVPLEPGQVKPPSGERPAPIPVEVHGTVGRTLPARMVRDAAEPGPSAADHVPDHRPLTIGSDFAVERVAPEGPHQAMRENFVDLLGKGSEWEVDRRLEHEWSALQRQGRVEQMMGEDGYPIRVKVGRHEVEAVVRMELSDPRIRDVGGAELSQVDRREYTESSSASRSELLPPSRSVGVSGELGLGVKQSSGAQASRSISDSGGARFEHNVFATTNEAHSGGFTAKYRITFSRDGKFMHEAVTHGGVNLTVAGHELADARARQETTPPPEIPDGGAPAVGPGGVRPAAGSRSSSIRRSRRRHCGERSSTPAWTTERSRSRCPVARTACDATPPCRTARCAATTNPGSTEGSPTGSAGCTRP